MNSPRMSTRRKLSSKLSFRELIERNGGPRTSFSSIGNSPRVSAKRVNLKHAINEGGQVDGDGSEPEAPHQWNPFEAAQAALPTDPHAQANVVDQLSTDSLLWTETDTTIDSAFAEDIVDDSLEVCVEEQAIRTTPPEAQAAPEVSIDTPEDELQPTCLICFETFAEDDITTSGCGSDACKSYVFSSAMKKNKKLTMPCKCQEGKESPEYVHQQCLLTWQNKMAKTSCPLCRQPLFDSRTIFREAFLSCADQKGRFLSEPVKEEWGVMQCAVRSVTQFGLTRLQMVSEETGKVLLEARRTSTSSFVGPEYGIFADHERCGSLSSNLMGTTWNLKSQNEELLCIQYSVNRAWNKEPRKMRLLAPGITESGEQVIHHCPRSRQGSLAGIMASSTGVPHGIDAFQNRFPHWNEEMGAFCLNFGGRVQLASVKNFQIMHGNEHPENPESDTLIQFGRVDEDSFNLDVQFPFSPLQAFAACVSSYYGKILVE
jgi:hypothetical protein